MPFNGRRDGEIKCSNNASHGIIQNIVKQQSLVWEVQFGCVLTRLKAIFFLARQPVVTMHSTLEISQKNLSCLTNVCGLNEGKDHKI